MVMANNNTAEQKAQMMEEEPKYTSEKPRLVMMKEELMFVDKNNRMVASTGENGKYLTSTGSGYMMDCNKDMWGQKKKVAYMWMWQLNNRGNYRRLTQLYYDYYRDYCILEKDWNLKHQVRHSMNCSIMPLFLSKLHLARKTGGPYREEIYY